MAKSVNELYPGRQQYTPYEQVLFLGSLAKDETFPDSLVASVFLETEISSEEDILLAFATLEEFRPGVIEMLSALPPSSTEPH